MLELIEIVREKGLPAFALTDHSPVHNTPPEHFSVMLRRMPKTIRGIRVFKGIEATILDTNGSLSVPYRDTYTYEIILAGLHEYGYFADNRDIGTNTTAVINVMRNNPDVKIITHPFYRAFPLDLDAVTDVALETDTALEINNSYILTGKSDRDALDTLLGHVNEKKIRISVDSDGHMINEVGEFSLALEELKRFGVDESLIVNRTMESTLAFLGLEE